jgi:hypothetical protein
MSLPRKDLLQIDDSYKQQPTSPNSGTDNSPDSDSNVFLGNSLIEFTDEDSNILIDTIQVPLSNKPLERFIRGNVFPQTTFHQIAQVEEMDDEELRVYYFKMMPKREVGDCPYLAELEAALAEFYHFLAPRQTPAMHAVYDKDNNYVGVVSEKIPFFNPASVSPLLLEDLDDGFIREKNLSFAQLDVIDDALCTAELAIESLHRKLQRIIKFETLTINEIYLSAVPANTVADLKEIFAQQYALKISLLEQWHNNKQRLHELYARIVNEQNITCDEIKKYRKMKGLSNCLSVSFIWREDDLNRNNMSPDGKRIDFDMSEWDFLYNISKKGLLVTTLRKPSVNDAKIDAEDILHFPNLVTVKPFYWPTQTLNITESALAICKQYFTLSSNPWSSAEVEVYKQLEFNSIFVYHKFATFLKYILSHYTMYQKLARLHIRRERSYGASLVVEYLANIQRCRIDNMENVLTRMPVFASFFAESGLAVKNQFARELKKRNAELDKKISALAPQTIASADTTLYEDLVDGTTRAQQLSTNAALTRLYEYQKIDLGLLNAAYDNIEMIIQLNRRKGSLDPEQKLSPSSSYIQAEELTFQKTKAQVITALKSYINPGFFYGKGVFRRHIDVANAIITFCDGLSPEMNFANPRLSRLQGKIQTVINTLPDGTLKTTLVQLIEIKELWVCPFTKVSPELTPTEISTAPALKLV